MAGPHLPPSLDPRDEAELAAYADGSLAPERRIALEERLEREPALAALAAEQRAAARVVRSAAADVHAPDSLRMGVEAERARLAPARRRRKLALAGALAAVTGAMAVAVVASLPGGSPGSPTIVEAAALAAKPATNPAPRPAPAQPGLLEISQAGVPFPDYAGKLGWRAVGSRHDELDGRDAITVFYENGGRRVGYTILDGSFIAPPEDSARFVREGVPFWSYDVKGRMIVTWKRGGRTCVLSARGVPAAELLSLAGWRGDGAR